MIHAEPHDVRLLVVDHGSLLVGGKQVVEDANDGAYSPDGTLLAFVRAGDLWLANADGSGRRRLGRTPSIDEWTPASLAGLVAAAADPVQVTALALVSPEFVAA